MFWLQTLPLFLFCLTSGESLYVPGVSPNEYKFGEALEVNVKFCNAYVSGEILRGDRVVNTPYVVKMGENIPCAMVCEPIQLNNNDKETFSAFIKNQYNVHLLIDNLPSGTRLLSDNMYEHFEYGYKIGFTVDENVYVNNHLRFRLKYHQVNNVSEQAISINKDSCSLLPTAQTADGWKLLNTATKLQFTYEVLWESSDIEWLSRWDIYLKVKSGQVHWFSIINSVVIVLFLASLISMILIRTLRKDIAKYNRDEDIEDILEESGWKLVHGDVFRPPRHTRLFTAIFGSGLQLFFMVFIVIFFAMLGTLSPASQGGLLSAAIFTYVFMGLFSGYFAGRMYKTLKGQLWKSTAITTAVLFPSIGLSIILVLNSFIWYKGSSAAMPFGTLISLLSLWFFISLPLTFIGFFFGYRKRGYDQPIRTNQIPRAVPDYKFRHNLLITTLCSGALPFGAVFIEVFFIYNAIWESQVYYLFGFLFMVFIILIICCAQVAIVSVYFQLCNENYHWWWRTLISSGGAAFYLFSYSVFYFMTKLNIKEFIPTLIYFGYTALITIAFWILTGTIGFISTFIFLRYIYAAIKID